MVFNLDKATIFPPARMLASGLVAYNLDDMATVMKLREAGLTILAKYFSCLGWNLDSKCGNHLTKRKLSQASLKKGALCAELFKGLEAK